MVDDRVRSMDEEVGLLAISNEVLARSKSRTDAIVLRAITAYSTGVEVEVIFANRAAGDPHSFERWDNMDTSEQGMKLGFSVPPATPTLYSPREGSSDKPMWMPSSLWGGAGGDRSQVTNLRSARLRITMIEPMSALVVGWSWRGHGIEPGARTFELPSRAEMQGFIEAVWQ